MNLQLFEAINGLAGRNQWLDNLMVFCSEYLIYVIGLIFAVCLGYLLYKKQWRTAVWLLSTLVISFVILKVVGSFIIENRPFIDHRVMQLVPHDIDNSFPSDHATAALAMAVGLSLFTRWRALAAGVIVLALLVGLSRVFVGVHYPGDVLAGWLIAIAGGLIAYFVARFFKGKQADEPTV
ncbi:MAG TPA: phosphatase PAP2 family protein [Candidatus Saccharimonadales bacterium]|nr:phosphatase PAP2 family protein [Candidatus Saccharimonadales bacterium]